MGERPADSWGGILRSHADDGLRAVPVRLDGRHSAPHPRGDRASRRHVWKPAVLAADEDRVHVRRPAGDVRRVTRAGAGGGADAGDGADHGEGEGRESPVANVAAAPEPEGDGAAPEQLRLLLGRRLQHRHQ